MTATFQFSTVEEVPVFSISGYVDDTLGKELTQEIGKCLREGKRNFIFEFSGCPLINSLGISHILEITLKVTEDFQGILVLVSVPQVVMKVLKLAGVIPQAQLADSIQNALAIIKPS